MLEVEVRHSLGDFRLDVAFAAKGTVLAVVGPSGAGKSALLAAIGGAYRPAAGRIVRDGTVYSDSATGAWTPPERRRIGWVYQDARLFPHMPVRDNLVYGLKRSRGRRIVEFDEAVRVLELSALLDRRPGELSGGEKQRVALGRALLSQPDLVLMDEPLAALHAGLKAEILAFIERLKAAFGLPMVYVTHSPEEAIRIADEAVLIEDGKVRDQGPPAMLLGARWAGEGKIVGRTDRGEALVAVPGLEGAVGERLRVTLSPPQG